MEPAGIDYGAWKLWIGIAQWAFNLVVTGYLWVSRRHGADLGQIRTNERMILDLKTRFECMPTERQIEDLSHEMRGLTKELSETKGRLSGLNRAVDLINEFLINQGKRQ